MKNKTLFKSIGLVCATSLFLLVSCKKDDSAMNEANSDATITQKNGLIPDDPTKVGKVPLIVSEEYLNNQSGLVAGNVKPTGQNLTGRARTISDKTLPVVSIVSPTNNAAVSGTVNIQASASDNVGVSLVTFYIDGVSKGTKSTSPYTYAWNTSGLASGTHTIKVTAQDAAGNISSASIQVGYNAIATGDIAPPSVTITSPVGGTAFNIGETVNVAVSASDNTGVYYVSFSLDGVLVSNSFTAPYTFTVNTTNLSSGTHTLTAKAYDGYNNSASNSVLITLNTVVVQPVVLPSSFELMMPPVQDQGGESICAVMATTYAARSAEQFYKTKATSYSYGTNIVSPEFVYDQTKVGDCGSGTAVVTSLDFLMNVGVCTWQSMPYSSSNGCSLIPTSAQMSEASLYKISSYSKLLVSDITAMKNMVVNKHPLIVSLLADQSFLDATPGFIWRTYLGGGISHALVICGYDDAKHAYKVFNSWGTAWGDAGYGWIDYDLLPTIAYNYSYVINN